MRNRVCEDVIGTHQKFDSGLLFRRSTAIQGYTFEEQDRDRIRGSKSKMVKIE